MADFYKDEQNAHLFSSTRFKPWPALNYFIKNFTDENDFFYDSGCGNGRNSKNLKHIVSSDSSYYLLKYVQRGSEFLFDSGKKNIFKNEIFDQILSVAVIHHIFKREDRLFYLNSLRKLKQKYIFLSCWSEEILLVKKNIFVEERVYNFRWNNEIDRYYRIDTYENIKEEIRLAKLEIVEYFTEKQNHYFILK